VDSNRKIFATHIGIIEIHTHKPNGEHLYLQFNNCYLVPQMTGKLLSTHAITDKQYTVSMQEIDCIICDPNGIVILVIPKIGRSYAIPPPPENSKLITSSIIPMSDLDLWHRRLSHLNTQYIQRLRMMSYGLPEFKHKNSSTQPCHTCKTVKSSRQPFPLSKSEPEKIGSICSDYCNPFRTPTNSGKMGFITFLNEYTDYCEVHLVRNKSEALQLFKEFNARFKVLHSPETIYSFRSDGGGEYYSNAFENYLKSEGILHQKTTPHTPESNG
jgi:hypothetical protein